MSHSFSERRRYIVVNGNPSEQCYVIQFHEHDQPATVGVLRGIEAVQEMKSNRNESCNSHAKGICIKYEKQLPATIVCYR